MLDICLLGTGGMMPLPNRWLTSLLARFNGSSLLIDCGEGTQIALREAGFSPNPIDLMLFTHFHADHISGLPGMLLSMANSDRTEPVDLIGPKGLARVVRSLCCIAPELPFELRFHEIEGTDTHFSFHGYEIDAFRVRHNVTCFGYSFSIPRAGRFDTEAAKAAGIPLCAWNPLQKGQTVEIEGAVFTPDMVMGPPRKGLKVTYCTDTRPCESIVKAASGSDLFICEGMYGEPGSEDKARAKKHMTFQEAARLARDAGVTELWLTHYSPSLVAPKQYLKSVRDIFQNSYAARDGRRIEMDFPEA